MAGIDQYTSSLDKLNFKDMFGGDFFLSFMELQTKSLANQGRTIFKTGV